MAKKQVKRTKSEEHKQKLRESYNRRRQAQEAGIRLPTQKEIREAKRAKKEPITVQSVNQLMEETPVTEQEVRVNNPTVTKYESASNPKHPLRLRKLHEQVRN